MLAEMFIYIIERSQNFTTALTKHLYLTFVSLGISVSLGLLLGIVATRIAWLRTAVLNFGNLARTIPSLAVLALALPLLGIGDPPTILALVFIGMLPILINTVVGIEEVADSVKEAARGMGMSDLEVLYKVELPIATAVIMAGIRTSAVIVVASATLAAFIGGGGLGDLILQGHALGRDHVMLAGAIPATLLAFYFEEMFGRLENWATPTGLKVAAKARQSGGFLGLLATVTVLPLIFGVMLPWHTVIGAEGEAMIRTGLHPGFRSVGLPVLLLSLLASLWPRGGERGQPWPVSLLTTTPALGALLWMIVGYFQLSAKLPTGQGLESGFFIQLGAVALMAVVASAELVLGFKDRQSVEDTSVQPAAAKA